MEHDQLLRRMLSAQLTEENKNLDSDLRSFAVRNKKWRISVPGKWQL